MNSVKLLVYNLLIAVLCVSFVWLFSLCFQDAVSAEKLNSLRILLSIAISVPAYLAVDSITLLRNDIHTQEIRLEELRAQVLSKESEQKDTISVLKCDVNKRFGEVGEIKRKIQSLEEDVKLLNIREDAVFNHCCTIFAQENSRLREENIRLSATLKKAQTSTAGEVTL